MPTDFSTWFAEKISEHSINISILQIHESLIQKYSTLRAEEFLDELQRLWDVGLNSQSQTVDEIKPDYLYFSLKMCKEKLPPLLDLTENILAEISVENLVAFALYQVNF